jgi:hypothetical protein
MPRLSVSRNIEDGNRAPGQPRELGPAPLPRPDVGRGLRQPAHQRLLHCDLGSRPRGECSLSLSLSLSLCVCVWRSSSCPREGGGAGGVQITKGNLLGAGMHGTTPSGTSDYYSVDVGLLHIAALSTITPTVRESWSFLRVHWVAVPQAVRARRVNRAPSSPGSTRTWPPPTPTAPR